ncbi:hypothetical protein K1719_037867 [Acacia pycnantha]|nr:hypothetical protein K1719_037867 [Acacia pycnantha]
MSGAGQDSFGSTQEDRNNTENLLKPNKRWDKSIAYIQRCQNYPSDQERSLLSSKNISRHLQFSSLEEGSIICPME